MRIISRAMLILLFFAPHLSKSQVDTVALTADLNTLLDQSRLPGFAVAIVTPDTVLYRRGFGFADLEQKSPYTDETIQNIGSVSKTFIGVALMKLVAEGRLTLDTDINQILPFRIVHPGAPEAPILLRHLATHSSGIADSRMYDKSYYLREPVDSYLKGLSRRARRQLVEISGNTTLPLGDYLREYLTEEGDFYRRDNFTGPGPGAGFHYSNIGAALAAYVIEIVTGQSFREYTQTQILNRLGMDDSGWRFEDIDLNAHATLYFPNRVPHPRYSLVTYPDGGLLTNCRDLSRYLREMLRGYYGECDLLPPAAFREMMSVQFARSAASSQGFFWEITAKGNIGHNGADPGVFAYLLFNPEKRYGQLFLTNIAVHEDRQLLKSFQAIWQTVNQYGDEWTGNR